MIRLALLTVVLASCKLLSETKQLPVEQRETLFDMLISKTPDKKVPYPFSKLVTYLSQYGQIVAVLIPLGRSSQRHDGHPELFRDPRRLVGLGKFNPAIIMSENVQKAFQSVFQKLKLPSPGMAEFDIGGRLFLGYVEQANRIEVMSLLPIRGEFDFQVVENYTSEKRAPVELPNRELCLSCHQQGAPIFTPNPWAETNANPIVATLIKRHYPEGMLDGIPIEHNKPPKDLANPSQLFDSLVRQAGRILQTTKIWNTTCLGVRDKATCRALFLKNTFSLFNLSPAADVKANIIPVSSLGFIEDRNIFDLLTGSSNNIIEDYNFSEKFKSVISKISRTENFPKLAEKENDVVAANAKEIIKQLMSSDKIIGSHHLTPLTVEEIELVYDEVEDVLIHTHKLDSHLNTNLDPSLLRKQPQMRPFRFDALVFDVLEDTAHIFRQQALLQTNKGKIEIITVAVNISNGELEISATLPKLGFTRNSFHKGKDEDNGTNTCQGKEEINCVFNNLLPDKKSQPIKELTFYFSGSDTLEKKPNKISRILFTGGEREHNIDLLCRKTMGHTGFYVCTTHDPWRIGDAIMRTSKDKNSHLHKDYINIIASIKDILSHLGYDLKTYTGMDFNRHRDVKNNSDSSKYLPNDKLGRTLIKHCGGCHGRYSAYPFLYAENKADFCKSILHKRKNMVDAIASKRMPPADAEPQLKTSARTYITDTLEVGKFSFCN